MNTGKTRLKLNTRDSVPCEASRRLTWGAVADHGGQEPRAQVTSRINSVAYRHELSGLLARFQELQVDKRNHTSLHSQRSTNAEDHDEKDEGGKTGWRRPVSGITHGAYNDEQHGGPKELKNI